jgi:hypothetical protein
LTPPNPPTLAPMVCIPIEHWQRATLFADAEAVFASWFRERPLDRYESIFRRVRVFRNARWLGEKHYGF